MTVLNRNPQNTNPLQPSKFLLTFNRAGAVPYFCQQVNIPGMSMGSAPFNTPTLDISYPGHKLSFNSLNVTYIVDEELTAWKNMYDWFLALAHPNMDERKRLLELQGGKTTSDATLTVLSALNNPIARIQFWNVFPTDMSDINFDTTQSADTIIYSTVTFNFNYYEVLPL